MDKKPHSSKALKLKNNKHFTADEVSTSQPEGKERSGKKIFSNSFNYWLSFIFAISLLSNIFFILKNNPNFDSFYSWIGFQAEDHKVGNNKISDVIIDNKFNKCPEVIDSHYIQCDLLKTATIVKKKIINGIDSSVDNAHLSSLLGNDIQDGQKLFSEYGINKLSDEQVVAMLRDFQAQKNHSNSFCTAGFNCQISNFFSSLVKIRKLNEAQEQNIFNESIRQSIELIKMNNYSQAASVIKYIGGDSNSLLAIIQYLKSKAECLEFLDKIINRAIEND